MFDTRTILMDRCQYPRYWALEEGTCHICLSKIEWTLAQVDEVNPTWRGECKCHGQYYIALVAEVLVDKYYDE